MKTVVIGITSYAGGHIATELLKRGHEVLGVARDTAGSAAPVGAELRSGSVHDAKFLAHTLGNAAAIIVAIPARARDGKRLADAVPSLLKIAEKS